MAPPPAPRGRHLTARDAIFVVTVVAVLLILFEGRSVRHAGEEMRGGWERTLVLAFGRPAGWIADRLPLQDVVDDTVAWIKADDELSSGPGAFGEARAAGLARGGVPPVTPDAFDPTALGIKPRPPRPLHTLLVTGDSMAMPLDAELARRLAGVDGMMTIRDPHVGTGISQSEIVDWGRLSVAQVRKDRPDAVVVFIGANEGFPFRIGGRNVSCCGPDWTAEYATRARTMMNTYRQAGAARVYWLLLPGARDHDRQVIARAVDAADSVAAQAYRAQVRILDMGAIFTPGGRYRDAMSVDGREEIVRQADGVHLNPAGAAVAAGTVLRALRADFGPRVPTG
jgi:lysophospholipase L1-like esterase